MLNLNKRRYIRKNNYIQQAFAKVKGNEKFNKISGIVRFTQKGEGTLVKLEISGLPEDEKNNFFGFHIHEFDKCTPNDNDSFLDAGTHFDLEKNNHSNHTGDLPSIYSNNGYAYMEFYTNRFSIKDIIGKSIIIHEMNDDLKTNPSGNSGKRIACGVIQNMS